MDSDAPKKMNTAEECATSTENWLNQRRVCEDYHQYERRGKLNRTEIAQELGYARSVTGSNPKVKELLEDADVEFFGVCETNEDANAHKAAAERAEKRTGQIAGTNNTLEQRNAELEAVVAELRRKLRAYQERDRLIENGGAGFSMGSTV